MKLFVITGTSGAGKSTMKDLLAKRLDEKKYACIDSDEVGLNWWDYAGTKREKRYGNDTLWAAAKMAGGRDLVFVSCMNPLTYFEETESLPGVEATFFAALCPEDHVIEARLKARPAERGFTSPEKIRPHVEYNGWFRKNRSKFQLFIDNTDMEAAETAEKLAAFIERMNP